MASKINLYGPLCLACIVLAAGLALGSHLERRQLLEGWESYVPTYVELEQTQSGNIYINHFPFTTPPARDCFTRALALIPGCQPFMNIINENQGQISKSTVHELLELAKDNKTEVCYHKAVHFLNGGCICNNGLISTINVLTVVPRYAKEALTRLNRCKCPASPPPPPARPVSGSVPPPVAIATAATPRLAVPLLGRKLAAMNVAVAVEIPAFASEGAGAAPALVAAIEAAALAPAPEGAVPIPEAAPGAAAPVPPPLPAAPSAAPAPASTAGYAGDRRMLLHGE